MRYAKLSDFNFDLPPNLIATHPAEPRDSSRLLVLDKKTGKIQHKHFYDIIDYLNAGDILVLNNSKVIPARLFGYKKDTGGKVEVLLHKKVSANTWQCLLGGEVSENLELSFRSALGGEKSLKAGVAEKPLRDSSLMLGMTEKKGDYLTAKVLKNNNDGTWDLKFNKSGAALMKAIEKIGEMPLPPYIVKQRKEENTHPGASRHPSQEGNDQLDYQTVYADDKKAGSVAAPTAGLHFTPELLKKIKKKGVKILEITLYVGMGTFAPVKTEDISKHKMHAEWVEIDKSTIKNLQSSIKDEKRIIAVGTTSARSLEACWNDLGLAKPITHPGLPPLLKLRWTRRPPLSRGEYKAWVDIFITPGYEFKIVDGLITNFHFPKSTLLMLVSALAGKKHIDKAYRDAVKLKYRFYSYGDAMLII